MAESDFRDRRLSFIQPNEEILTKVLRVARILRG